MEKILYVGMDVHKNTIAMACAAQDEAVTMLGIIPNTFAALNSMLRKLVSRGERLKLVYEAGPGGYTLCRYLRDNGFHCIVAAPSLIPRKSGDKIKTDRRDAIMLTRLHRAGELTSVCVPDADDEAMRDLFRVRVDSKKMCKAVKQQLLGFLLRHGISYSAGKTHWTKTHYAWLDALSIPHPVQQLVLQEYLDAIRQLEKRTTRIEEMLLANALNWKRLPEVKKLQCLRGISFITAVGLMAELGDLRRFPSARQMMAYVGLVPSESSSSNDPHQRLREQSGGHYPQVFEALVD